MTERKIDFMKTDLFHIGKFVIHGYGLMIGIGFVLALLVGEYRAKKMGMKEEALIDIAIIAGVSGFLGAKLLYIIVSFKDFIEDPKLKKQFINGEYTAFGAFHEAEMVGMMGIRNGNHISLLFVDERYHKKGVATALFSYFLHIKKRL